jgi:catechol 1,2-dioxygenase
MNPEQVTRLRAVFKDVQRAVEDTTAKHQVTVEEWAAFAGWVDKAAARDKTLLAALLLLGIPAMTAAEGRAYADPEKDGASTFVTEGPAYVKGAPPISNPGLLPMRTDEAGEALFVSGTVRSTEGKPIVGAVIDLWENDAHGLYSSMTLEDAGPVPFVIDLNAPQYNLRGKITTDEQGKYAYRTIVPGPEKLTADDSMLAELLQHLDIVNSRPLHIHSFVTADGFYRLTHQIYFDDDPMIEHASEGPLDPGAIFKRELRQGSVPFGPEPPEGHYYTVTCDYVLRPVAKNEAPASSSAPESSQWFH